MTLWFVLAHDRCPPRVILATFDHEQAVLAANAASDQIAARHPLRLTPDVDVAPLDTYDLFGRVPPPPYNRFSRFWYGVPMLTGKMPPPRPES